MTGSRHTPKVSLGLPVYNGEAYVAESIESVLAQTYTNFELIIADNASTDSTREICEAYVKKDPRVSMHCHATNLGAAPNFNFVFQKAKGEYFKWVAHDDLIMPDYLVKCAEVLDRDPSIVLCHSLSRIIDGSGVVLDTYDSNIYGTSPAEIFNKIVLQAHWCTDMFALIRASALRRTQLIDSYHGADEIVLAELAMLGGFAKIDEPLFANREHDHRYSVHVPIHERAAWYDTAKKKKRSFPLWSQYREYYRSLRIHPLDRDQRRRCLVSLVKWWFVNWNAFRMVVDVLAAFEPRIFYLASSIKHRVFGSTAPSLQRGPSKSHG